VWEWSGSALDEGEDAAAWFSAYLGRPCRLMRHVGSPSSTPSGGSSTSSAVPADATRATDPEFAPGAEVGFADGFPMLFATEVRVLWPEHGAVALAVNVARVSAVCISCLTGTPLL
jgi:uncharacterized protein YcbX